MSSTSRSSAAGIVTPDRPSTKGSQTTPASERSALGSNTADTDAAINLVKTGTTASGTPILEAYDSATFDIEVDCVDAAAAGLSGGTYMPIVRMTAEVPYSDFFIGMIGLDDATFTVTHEELNVGE